jgi:hypothetical protein
VVKRNEGSIFLGTNHSAASVGPCAVGGGFSRLCGMSCQTRCGSKVSRADGVLTRCLTRLVSSYPRFVAPIRLQNCPATPVNHSLEGTGAQAQTKFVFRSSTALIPRTLADGTPTAASARPNRVLPGLSPSRHRSTPVMASAVISKSPPFLPSY